MYVTKRRSLYKCILPTEVFNVLSGYFIYVDLGRTSVKTHLRISHTVPLLSCGQPSVSTGYRERDL